MVTVTSGVLIAKTLKSVEISNDKVTLSADKLIFTGDEWIGNGGDHT